MPAFDPDRLVGRRFRTYKFIYRYCWQRRVDPEKFWAVPFDRLRLTLGETFQQLKVPFATSPALTTAITGGLTELITLSKQRHKELLDTAQADAALLDDDAPALPPATFALPETESASLAERVIASAVAVDPWLDAGLLRAWLSADGRGSSMLAQLSTAYRKAFLEERALVRTEPTTYVHQLALLRFLLPVWYVAIGDVPASLAERLEGAGAVALHALIDELVTAAFENPVLVDSTLIDVRAEYLLKTSVSPLSFVRDPDALIAGPYNPYGFGAALHEAVAERWSGVDLLRSDPEPLLEDATETLARTDAMQAALESAWFAEVRRHIVEVVGTEPDGGVHDLARLAVDPALVRRTITSRAARGALLLKLEQARVGLKSAAPERRERLVALEALIAGADQLRKDPAKAFGRRVVPERLVREEVRAVMVFELDRLVREIVNHQAILFEDRRLESRTSVVSAEYEAGRLYRIAGDDHPILRVQITREEGHLFIDLKDFTKRTHALKEVNMADFLKGEFYGPVLAAARELVGERGPTSLSLNNLLGDALSFSGDVRSLVEFSETVQSLLGRYLEKIHSRMPRSVVEGELGKLKARFAVEKAHLSAKRAQLEQVLRELSDKIGAGAREQTGTFNVGGGLLGEITRATNALYRLDERERSLDREVTEREEFLLGSELVAGVFIAWGAPPALVRITDPVFGEVKVAIAEKINEAARGTARNPEVRRRLDERLAAEARRSGSEARKDLPFRVYVEKVWRLPVPADLTVSFKDAVERRQPESAKRIFEAMSRRAADEFSRAAERKGLLDLKLVAHTHDLYNAGIAMSEEALGAYQRATHDRYQFFAKTVEVASLGAEFEDRFAFDAPTVRLVFAAGRGASVPRHVFRLAGSMTFRGFEQANETAIYELVNPRDSFHRMLVDRWFGIWYKAFRERGEGGKPFAREEDDEEGASEA